MYLNNIKVTENRAAALALADGGAGKKRGPISPLEGRPPLYLRGSKKKAHKQPTSTALLAVNSSFIHVAMFSSFRVIGFLRVGVAS